MTTIRNLAAPRVEGEVRPGDLRTLDRAMTGRRLVVLLGISALVLTAINLAASVNLLGAIGELRDVEARLEDVRGLERRLKGNLEVVNTGIHAQFDNLNRDLHAKITGLEDAVGAIQRHLDPQKEQMLRLPVLSADQPGMAEQLAEEPGSEALGSEPEEDPPIAGVAPKGARPAKPPVSQVGSAYQRIEAADGKVHYRRVQ